MIRLRTHDDRGQTTRLVRFVPLAGAGRAFPGAKRRAGAVLDSVRHVIFSRPGRWILLVATVLVALVWLTVEHGPQVIAFTLFSPVSGTIILLVCVTGVAGVNWMKERAEWIKRQSIRAGRCPACGYPLGAIEPEMDGCSVCPECGAAWRVRDPRYTQTGKRVVVVRTDQPEL